MDEQQIDISDYLAPPSGNDLLERKLREAREASAWVESPAWAWCKKHLEAAQQRLIHTVGTPGKEYEERLLLLGKLSLINDLLEKPAALVELLKVHSAPIPREERSMPRMGAPSLV